MGELILRVLAVVVFLWLVALGAFIGWETIERRKALTSPRPDVEDLSEEAVDQLIADLRAWGDVHDVFEEDQ